MKDKEIKIRLRKGKKGNIHIHGNISIIDPKKENESDKLIKLGKKYIRKRKYENKLLERDIPIFILRFFYNMKFDEISKIFNLTRSYTYNRYNSIVHRLYFIATRKMKYKNIHAKSKDFDFLSEKIKGKTLKSFNKNK